MTVDTSRPAVEALIAEHEMLWARGAYINVSLANQIEQTLAALLDERDRLAANRDAWVSDAMTSTTELEQRIRDLEATVDNLRLISNANGDWNIKYQEVNHRAERAETELLHARGISEIREAERDRLAANLEAVKAFIANRSVIGGMDRMRLAAILADTDEPKAGWVCSKCAREAVRGYDDGQIPEHHRTCSKRMPDTDEPRDSITFNTDDLGPATDIDGNPLADTDEGKSNGD